MQGRAATVHPSRVVAGCFRKATTQGGFGGGAADVTLLSSAMNVFLRDKLASRTVGSTEAAQKRTNPKNEKCKKKIENRGKKERKKT